MEAWRGKKKALCEREENVLVKETGHVMKHLHVSHQSAYFL